MHPTGLEPPPKDWQYEVVHQMLHPLIHENRNGYNDITTTYNPNKYDHTLGEYVQLASDKKNESNNSDSLAQVDPVHPTGLEPPPKDWQYEVPHQMLHPLIHENRNGYNDITTRYNPNKYDHTLGEYS